MPSLWRAPHEHPLRPPPETAPHPAADADQRGPVSGIPQRVPRAARKQPSVEVAPQALVHGADADAPCGELRSKKAEAPPLAPQREGPETDSRDAVQRAVMAYRNNTRSRRGLLPAVSLPTSRRKRRFQPEK